MRKKKEKEIVEVNETITLPTLCSACGKELQEEKDVLVFDACTETLVLREKVKRCGTCNTDYFIENNCNVVQYYFFFGTVEHKWVKPISDQELAVMNVNKELVQQPN